MEDREFYVPYIEGSLGSKTKRVLKRFTIIAIGLIIIAAVVFSLVQRPFKNSTFELTSTTKITGTFHESPYPMLRVKVADNSYKNILLLGFGKSSANPFLEKLLAEVPHLNGRRLTIEGNLIYYNGKTLLQITDEEKVILENQKGNTPVKTALAEMTLQGEIIDPKCYFGVMKPGYGKIHRSCAVRCISGGIPPVLATTDDNNISEYYLLTDLNGNAINKDVLPYVGQPSEMKGTVEIMEDWYILKLDIENLTVISEASNIYSTDI
ncbi:MAG: hypothetical protein ED556_12290 [Winogradskyella sp.]|uniref:hypothetical protein n=1 Tax=Winogradskyella sp. TaxID=1883156 RepID=UPI000F3E8505|nr:hypothetical protein [Winogradskyella sp.]RNC84228.1 MAG: hypothetical protein ED556_12290 [Winogradskyella sp.]